MKILFVITGLGVGGAERQVIDLAECMVACGCWVRVVYLTGPAITVPVNKKVETIGLGMEKSILSFFHSYRVLRRMVLDFSPDVVHSHMFHANLMARLLRISTPMSKLVCTAHNTNEGGRLRMLAYRLTARLADVNTNVSVEAVEAFVRAGAVAPGSMLPVTNGIDIRKFNRNDHARSVIRQELKIFGDKKVFLAVGRLCAAKDYPNLLMAYAQLSKSSVNHELWIIGGGDCESELRNLAISLEVNERVRFLGVQNNISEWMSSADIFVLSSAWEGFGLVVAEAMACERVVVATDAGGVREVLGDCGFLVVPRESVLLARSLQLALNLTAKEAVALGVKARERVVNNYSLEAAVKRWLEVYDCS